MKLHSRSHSLLLAVVLVLGSACAVSGTDDDSIGPDASPGAVDDPETGTHACYAPRGQPAQSGLPAGATRTLTPLGGGELDPLFAEVAREFDIPERLLKAVVFAETRFTMIHPHEHHGMEPAYGLMALRGDNLRRGAELAGVALRLAQTDERASLRAGAALLDAHATELGLARGDARRDDLGAWEEALLATTGIAHQAASAHHVTQIYDVLREGVAPDTEAGTVRATLAADPFAPSPGAFDDDPAPMSGHDYPAAVWRPSPNYNSRPSGTHGTVAKVIVHTCEGGYAGCWGWLTNPSSSVSAHYVVSESGHEVSQLVRDHQRGWHIAAAYDCSRNSNVSCHLNGYASNDFTIGIEHAGYASQTTFPAGQLQASAELACAISKKWGVPLDRNHFVGHGQLQPWNRTDPGNNWPWTEYLERARAACDDGSLIIDTNNDLNDPDQAFVDISDSWTGTTLTPGYYGSGYYFNSTTAEVCDPARFWFYLPEGGTMTIEAWWTAGQNRSARAPFIAFDADGNELGTVHADQQQNGSRWVELGTWQFSPGWNQVALSRQTDGDVVIADALRIREP